MSVENYLEKLSDNQLKWAIQRSQEILKEREERAVKGTIYLVSDEYLNHYALPEGQWGDAIDAAIHLLNSYRNMTTPDVVKITVTPAKVNDPDSWVSDLKWKPMSCCWCGKS